MDRHHRLKLLEEVAAAAVVVVVACRLDQVLRRRHSAQEEPEGDQQCFNLAPAHQVEAWTTKRRVVSLRVFSAAAAGWILATQTPQEVVEECQVAAWVLVRALHSETEGNASVLNRKGVD